MICIGSIDEIMLITEGNNCSDGNTFKSLYIFYISFYYYMTY